MPLIEKVFTGSRNFINDCVNELLDMQQRKGVEVCEVIIQYKHDDFTKNLIGLLHVVTNERKD